MKTRDAEMVLLDPNATGSFAVSLEQAHALTAGEISRQVAMANSFWDESFSWVRPYRVNADGVLVIPIKGSLLHDFPFQLGGWATGYEYINEAIQRGVEDDRVSVIALEINSPGGYVSGNFDLVDRIATLREQKPIHALVNERACSAAYNIAAACTSISVPRTGQVGSIGVLRVHTDISGFMEGRGIRTTFIHAGKHKVDGNSLEPLSDSVKEQWQAEVESTYSDFVASVARNRGMEETAIRETEARVYQATDALRVGLVDKIGPFPESLVALSTLVNSDEPQEEFDLMADTKPMFDEAALEAVKTEAKADGFKEGAAAERARINAILGSDEAKDRPKAAMAAALKTDMTAEAAASFLADLPKEKAEAEHETPANGSFVAAMSGTPNPNLGMEAKEGDGQGMTAEEKSVSRAQRALAAAGIKKEAR